MTGATMRAETIRLWFSVLAINALTLFTFITPNLVSQLKNKPVGHTRHFYRLTVNYPWSKPEPLRRTLRRTIKYRGRAALGIHCINNFNVTGTPSGGNCKTYSHKTFNTPLSSPPWVRSEEHTSELQSRGHLVCRLLLEK